jgi:hypothetical protein
MKVSDLRKRRRLDDFLEQSLDLLVRGCGVGPLALIPLNGTRVPNAAFLAFLWFAWGGWFHTQDFGA